MGGALGQRRRGPRTLRREPPCKDLEVSVQERNSTSDSDSQPKRKECSLSACLSVAESVASEAHFCRGSDGGPAPPQVASAPSLRGRTRALSASGVSVALALAAGSQLPFALLCGTVSRVNSTPPVCVCCFFQENVASCSLVVFKVFRLGLDSVWFPGGGWQLLPWSRPCPEASPVFISQRLVCPGVLRPQGPLSPPLLRDFQEQVFPKHQAASVSSS